MQFRPFLLVAGLCAAGSIPAQGVGDVDIETQALDELICPDVNVFSDKMINNVCWDCMYPIKVAGSDTAPSQGNDAYHRHASGMCQCPCYYGTRYGVTVGYWSPSRIVEMVRKPYCFPTLGGTDLSLPDVLSKKIQIGRHRSHEHANEEGSEVSFGQTHFYIYPIVAILDIFDEPDCVDGASSDFDLVFMSEYTPTWDDDEMSGFLHPENTLFANPMATLLGIPDCLMSSFMLPPSVWQQVNDITFWYAGCWGSIYPFSGKIADDDSPVRAASLMAVRTTALMARVGLLGKHAGDQGVCGAVRMPIIEKSVFRLQQFWPMPEVDRTDPYSGPGTGSDPPASPPGAGGGWPPPGAQGASLADENFFSVGSAMRTCCHPMGANTLMWGDWRSTPGVGENYIQLLWRWHDCCVGPCVYSG